MRRLRTGLAASVMAAALVVSACNGDDEDLDPDAPAAVPDENGDDGDTDSDADTVADDELNDDADVDEPEPTETEDELPDLPDGGLAYTVEAGDTLSTIAAQFDLSAADLIEANDLTDPDQLSPGDELIIPPSGNGGDTDEDEGDNGEA